MKKKSDRQINAYDHIMATNQSRQMLMAIYNRQHTTKTTTTGQATNSELQAKQHQQQQHQIRQRLAHLLTPTRHDPWLFFLYFCFASA